MKYRIYQVDAFAENVFEGNPAAVCPLNEWIEDALLVKIAAENNLSETAFYVVRDKCVEIRWFTPKEEVDLCGHATLAAALVLAQQENYRSKVIPFFSIRSGSLPVTIRQDAFTLNLPRDEYKEIELSEDLLNATSLKPLRSYRGKTNLMLLFKGQKEVEQLQPRFAAIKKLDARGLIVTAKGDNCDFVSRFFAPQLGINEDPVTGSAHTLLAPYWSKQLDKFQLEAEQVSERKGKLICKIVNDRVEITGKAVLFMKGEIYV